MAKPLQNGQSDDKKELKSPKKQTPVICYGSIFAENCDASMVEEVAEEVMEMTEEEMPLDVSQEELSSSEEEQTSSPTIPENLEELNILKVLFCWFGLACTAVHAFCTGNTCRCQICQMTLLRRNAIETETAGAVLETGARACKLSIHQSRHVEDWGLL